RRVRRQAREGDRRDPGAGARRRRLRRPAVVPARGRHPALMNEPHHRHHLVAKPAPPRDRRIARLERGDLGLLARLHPAPSPPAPSGRATPPTRPATRPPPSPRRSPPCSPTPARSAAVMPTATAGGGATTRSRKNLSPWGATKPPSQPSTRSQPAPWLS